jgi:hypothetical protein
VLAFHTGLRDEIARAKTRGNQEKLCLTSLKRLNITSVKRCFGVARIFGREAGGVVAVGSSRQSYTLQGTRRHLYSMFPPQVDQNKSLTNGVAQMPQPFVRGSDLARLDLALAF